MHGDRPPAAPAPATPAPDENTPTPPPAQAHTRRHGDGATFGPFKLPDQWSNLVAIGILALIGGGGGGLIGGSARAADKTELANKLDTIQASVQAAFAKQETLVTSVNELRSDLAIVKAAKFEDRAGKLEDHLHELERQVSRLEEGLKNLRGSK